ncbi:hypothetical protein [Neodiprion abietis nucleopolyhedrovirus]|uniref:RING-type domain-containing protein n=1 Tax=Neodiprion abietis nucleopolyhedrovirus TaxID=204507 RepID=Q0ZP56_9CBAC|nr:hypothetical protein [Neodiprion abietis nucleopolyhedrovirus]ABC74898.1 unknown [Neodiprion abietis nucleopolyhedrovirus]
MTQSSKFSIMSRRFNLSLTRQRTPYTSPRRSVLSTSSHEEYREIPYIPLQESTNREGGSENHEMDYWDVHTMVIPRSTAPVTNIDDEATQQLADISWPGNGSYDNQPENQPSTSVQFIDIDDAVPRPPSPIFSNKKIKQVTEEKKMDLETEQKITELIKFIQTFINNVTDIMLLPSEFILHIVARFENIIEIQQFNYLIKKEKALNEEEVSNDPRIRWSQIERMLREREDCREKIQNIELKKLNIEFVDIFTIELLDEFQIFDQWVSVNQKYLDIDEIRIMCDNQLNDCFYTRRSLLETHSNVMNKLEKVVTNISEEDENLTESYYDLLQTLESYVQNLKEKKHHKIMDNRVKILGWQRFSGVDDMTTLYNEVSTLADDMGRDLPAAIKTVQHAVDHGALDNSQDLSNLVERAYVKLELKCCVCLETYKSILMRYWSCGHYACRKCCLELTITRCLVRCPDSRLLTANDCVPILDDVSLIERLADSQ